MFLSNMTHSIMSKPTYSLKILSFLNTTGTFLHKQREHHDSNKMLYVPTGCWMIQYDYACPNMTLYVQTLCCAFQQDAECSSMVMHVLTWCCTFQPDSVCSNMMLYVQTWRCTFQYNPTNNSLDIIGHFIATDGTVQLASAADPPGRAFTFVPKVGKRPTCLEQNARLAQIQSH